MKESSLWRAARGHLTQAGVWAIRIENGAMPGTPDVWWWSPRWDKGGWIELKIGHRKVRTGAIQLPTLREEQQWWLEEARRYRIDARWLIQVAGVRPWLLLPGERLDALDREEAWEPFLIAREELSRRLRESLREAP